MGLVGFGFSCAIVIQAGLGAMSWDVLTLGLMRHVGGSYGAVTVITSFIVLALWVPLKEKPGLGTILNAILVGISADFALRILPEASSLFQQIVYLMVGIVAFGFFDALYIGAQLGTGPRDGLMTGLSRVSGWSIGLVRTIIEVAVVAFGWVLGGSVGVATIVTAFGVGPVIAFFLPYVTVSIRR